MAQRLVICSDTHLPRRARALPPRLWADIEAADVVVHAGDWVSLDAYAALESRSRRLIGVYGNNDGPQLRNVLPLVARTELDGVRIAVVHETGPSVGRDTRMAAAFPDVDVLIFGHSHIPWDDTADGGRLRLLNPGSPTDRRRQPTGTWLTATAEDGALRDVRTVRP